MASTQLIKRRIRSVKNTRQITKAMELVSASKMRRAQEATLKSRPYSQTAQYMLNRLGEVTNIAEHPLFAARDVKTKLYVIVSSDRGLAGAFNSNLYKLLIEKVKEDIASKVAVQAITLGKQAGKFMARLPEVELLEAYNALPDHPAEADILPLFRSLAERFVNGSADQVNILYTDYRSSIVQVVTLSTLLPAVYVQSNTPEELDGAIIEPSPKALLDAVAERLVRVQLWQDLLESQASEQSMRMMAMKNASDNASELIDDLTLELNKARQASITQELAEITGGAEAIK